MSLACGDYKARHHCPFFYILCWVFVTSVGESLPVITGKAPVNKAKEPIALKLLSYTTMELLIFCLYK